MARRRLGARHGARFGRHHQGAKTPKLGTKGGAPPSIRPPQDPPSPRTVTGAMGLSDALERPLHHHPSQGSPAALVMLEPWIWL